ncbi:MAG: collagen-binding domain-containing protein [Spirosomataceae bacterium]
MVIVLLWAMQPLIHYGVWYKDDNNAINNIRITKQGSTYGNPSPAFIDVNSNINTLGVDTLTNPVCQANIINFTDAFTQLKTNSTNLTLCQSNTETWADGAKVTDISGKNLLLRDAAGATGPRIWNVTGTQLNHHQ